MIKSLKIKDVATFDKEGITVENLTKVNFIYGANGSGKTTISDFLASPSSQKNNNCEIIWENDAPMKIITYNRQFRDTHLNSDKIPGVFTLGSATKDHLDRIEKLMGELKNIKKLENDTKGTLKKLEVSKKGVENEFRETCWSYIKKKREDIFSEAFSGLMGSKDAFCKRVINEHKCNKGELKTSQELISKAKTIFGHRPSQLDKIILPSYDQLTEIESNTIWKKKIIGKSDIEIASLIQRLGINDWVNQGRYFIEEDSEICPFCQKRTIDSNFRKQLEEYFDETFTRETELIKDLSQRYIATLENTINTLIGIENKESHNADTKLNLQLFTSYIKTINQQLISNKELLNNKLKEPSRTIELICTKEQLELIQTLIHKANIEIDNHNMIVANFKTERDNLISDVWRYLVEEHKTSIESFIKKNDGSEKGLLNLQKNLDDLNTQYDTKNAEIIEANKNVTSTQPSVDAINTTLASYGFTNFKIKPLEGQSNHYQIEREDGTIANKTLSEGEVTFITFLYFLQLAKGGESENSVSEDRVLVVDDPISSLDSTVLFVVSSLLKEIIKNVRNENSNINIKQLIILTHNVYFHKEVSFIDQRTPSTPNINFWILRKCNNITHIQHYDTKNPIRGSYELLWDELKNKGGLSGVTIQNTMRRIIEVYFKTMGKYKDEDLIKSFSTKEEQEICRSLMCWINDGSHCISDDFYVEHQEAINDKFFAVFKRIFNSWCI